MRNVQANSARRLDKLNQLAELNAQTNQEFDQFVKNLPIRHNKAATPTWRRWETFLIRQMKDGKKEITIVLCADGS